MVCSSMESCLTHLREWQLPWWCLVAQSSVAELHLGRLDYQGITRASLGNQLAWVLGFQAVLGLCLSCLLPWHSPGLVWSCGAVSFLTRSNFCHFGRTEMSVKTFLCENRRKCLAVDTKSARVFFLHFVFYLIMLTDNFLAVSLVNFPLCHFH